jgi:CMP-N-acetylneuraminic acid synthetase
MDILTIIPARKNSTRIKNKNILNFDGKPLIYYSIKEAKKSKNLNKIVVSTDSKKIAEIAKKYGAEVPYLRPKYLSKKRSSSWDVVKHVISFYKKKKIFFDYVLKLQPTSPLRQKKHIDEAIDLIKKRKLDGVVSICKSHYPEALMSNLPDSLYMKKFSKKISTYKISQDYKKYYFINGAIFLLKIKYLMNLKRSIYEGKVFGLEMPFNYSIDIDTKNDFKLAEIIFRESK